MTVFFRPTNTAAGCAPTIWTICRLEKLLLTSWTAPPFAAKCKRWELTALPQP
jgi:hypothetical protein